jgi:4-hydroxyproline epimerase
MQRLRVIDSHTGGEPTRVVLDGLPALRARGAAERVRELRAEHDELRTGVVLEPRGSDVLVGAYLLPPQSAGAVAQVIFFNNAGYLGMCGHGTIGVAETLAHLGRIGTGSYLIETPAGDVRFARDASGEVSVDNVRSYVHARDVEIRTESHGVVVGDIAWGGNWFFLVREPHLEVRYAKRFELDALASDVRRSLLRANITGESGGEIDHIELFGPPEAEGAHSKSYVLCPGFAYDRSPCGTGTSAKLACLAARGELAPGELWRQESVIGSTFDCSYREAREGGVLPTIRGRAFITAECSLVFDPRDPFRAGIRG